MREDRPSSSTASRIVSGSVGSIIYVTAFAPLEVVKVRQQAGSSSSPSSFSSSSSFGPPSPSSSSSVKALLRGRGAVVLADGLVVPTSSFPCLVVAPRAASSGVLSSLRTIARNEGRAGLYAGLKPTLYATVPNAAVYLASYDEISSRLSRRRRRRPGGENDDRDHRGHWIPFVAGASARLASSVVTAPLELVRTRQAANPIRHGGGVLEEFRLIVKTSGLAGLYRGLVPMILRDVPFGATYFPTLELTRNVMSNSTLLGSWGTRYHRVEMMGTRPPLAVEAFEAFVGGMIAGSFATVLTTPFDVVKTRRMTTTTSTRTAGLLLRPGGGGTMFDHMRRIVQEEGHAGLWRGNWARMMKVAPGSAIMISSYESGKRLLEDVM